MKTVSTMIKKVLKHSEKQGDLKSVKLKMKFRDEKESAHEKALEKKK